MTRAAGDPPNCRVIRALPDDTPVDPLDDMPLCLMSRVLADEKREEGRSG